MLEINARIKSNQKRHSLSLSLSFIVFILSIDLQKVKLIESKRKIGKEKRSSNSVEKKIQMMTLKILYDFFFFFVKTKSIHFDLEIIILSSPNLSLYDHE